jgi:hypothetical protein
MRVDAALEAEQKSDAYDPVATLHWHDGAQGGHFIADQMHWVCHYPVEADQISFGLMTLWDQLAYQSDPANLALYEKALCAWCVYESIVDAEKKRADRVGDVIFGGTWADHNYWGAGDQYPYGAGLVGKTSTQLGDTVTFLASGRAIYVCSIALVGSSGGQFSITVDGEDKGTYDCFGAYGGKGSAYMPQLIRIGGLTNTEHNVVVTITSSSGTVFFDWGAGSDVEDHPEVYAVNMIKTVNNTEGSCVAVDEMISDVCAYLSLDGLDVRYADAYSVYIFATDSADGVHPNDSGMAHIADALKSALELPHSVDIVMEMALGVVSISFMPLENIGTWGIDIDLSCGFDYVPPSGDDVNFQPKVQTTIPSNEVNFSLGSGLLFPQFILRTDWIHEAFGNLFDCVISPQSLEIMMLPEIYSPPNGDSLNFFPKVQDAIGDSFDIAYDEINWIWPLHCIVDTGIFDTGITFEELLLTLEQFCTLRGWVDGGWARVPLFTYRDEWETKPLKLWDGDEWKIVKLG